MLALMSVLVAPNTRIQLCFGLSVAYSASVVFMTTAPYTDVVCDRAQLVVLMQLVFTYISSILFFVDPAQPHRGAVRIGGLDEDSLGGILIAVNCAIFGLWDVRPLREWMYENFSLSVESMRSGRYHTMRTSCEFEPGSADAPMVS